MNNRTFVKEFLLLGFEGQQHIRALLFLLILFVYLITVFGNLLIIGLVGTHRRLHSPMYIFLCNLSFSDLMITTNVVPNLLAIIPEGRRTISFNGCATQLFLHGLLGTTECHLLTVMSYDRYLAICNPLHYTRIMDVILHRCIISVWIISFILIMVPFVHALQLSYCGANVLDNFFCDLGPLLALSCSDTFIIKFEVLFFSFFVLYLSFFLIVSSYVCILLTIVRIPSTYGRRKSFSTCSAHLIVVCTYFLTIITVYSNPSNDYSPNIKKLQSLLYIVMPSLFNPIIYALRNREIKSELKKLTTALRHKLYGADEDLRK